MEGVDVAPFVQPVGPTVNIPATFASISRLFFTTTLVTMIVEETNRYAREVLGDSVTSKWVDVVEEDIIIMGIPGVCAPYGHQPASSITPILEH
jgi:hypothetical protein